MSHKGRKQLGLSLLNKFKTVHESELRYRRILIDYEVQKHYTVL